jgi:glycosyltransferase involved in cell wall biosynthesis
MEKIAVVMAVYNAAEYLHTSIQSVLKQTFQEWILICVDDGSADNSLEILKKYAREDARIKVLSKKNGGPASARAEAYKIVEAPYTIMLDADDMYSPDLLDSLHESAVHTNADVIVPNFLIELKSGGWMNWNETYHWSLTDILTGYEAFAETFIQARIHGTVCWKTELVKRFATGEDVTTYNQLNADEYIQRLLFLNAKKVVFAKGTYIYRHNDKSITKSFSPKLLQYLDTCRKFIALKDEYEIDETTRRIIKEYYLRHIINLQIRLYKDRELSKERKKYMCAELRKSYKDALRYKKEYRFQDKKYPALYKIASVGGGYWGFRTSCFLFSFMK